MAVADAQVPPVLMTMDEYLRTSFRPDCDFVDDHIEERHVGDLLHSLLQMEVAFWFRSRQQEWKVRTMPELRTRVSASRVRLPDVSVAHDDGAIGERVRSSALLIAIEILSPEDRLSRVLVRLEDYLKMGTAHIWLLDPEERIAFVYTDAGLKQVHTSRLEVAGTPIYMDLNEVFAGLD
jgi:Uma2 family endonuclease